MELYVEDSKYDYGYRPYTLRNVIAGIVDECELTGEIYKLDGIIDHLNRSVGFNKIRTQLSIISKHKGVKCVTRRIGTQLWIKCITN